jgi:hypothetical protein
VRQEVFGVVEVSIIIPCYNQGHYLKKALDSVVAQEVAAWEAIVIDDGSTDETSLVHQDYDDGRIRYFFQENRGLSGARNTGIERARGRFVAFLDADDEWERGFLTRCLAELAGEPHVVGVYTGNSFIDPESRLLPQSGGARPGPGDFRRRLLEGGFFPVHAALVSRAAVEACGRFDEALSSLEDWDLWLRLSERGTMAGIPERLARYRVYPGSMSTDAGRMHANRIAVLEKHFGPPEAAPGDMNGEKRYAYAFAYRSAAIGFLEQGQADRCWPLMDEAVLTWPGIFERLDTYYELGCGRQKKGARGRPAPAEIEVNGQAIQAWLADFFARAPSEMQRKKRPAYGQAYLALAMLADQAGDWQMGRQYMRRALRANPRLAIDPNVIRRAAKMHLGKSLVESIKTRALTVA